MPCSASLDISNDIYSKAAVLEAKSKFSQFLQLNLRPKEKNLVVAEFTVLAKYEEDAREIILECLNYMADRSAQLLLEKEDL